MTMSEMGIIQQQKIWIQWSSSLWYLCEFKQNLNFT